MILYLDLTLREGYSIKDSDYKTGVEAKTACRKKLKKPRL
jgi:hypothetical protein